jgi:hypothetical protein
MSVFTISARVAVGRPRQVGAGLTNSIKNVAVSVELCAASKRGCMLQAARFKLTSTGPGLDLPVDPQYNWFF